MKILYIHGYNGSPDGMKLERIRQSYPKAEVIALQHDSAPVHVFELLNPIASKLDPSEDAIIGNSLGGFWANYFSLRYEIPALLINPAVTPSKTLRSMGCEFAKDYIAYEEQINLEGRSPRSVLLAKNDEVLAYSEAYKYFKNVCEVNTLINGGHAMNDRVSLDAMIMHFENLMNRIMLIGIGD
jgi:uncharacterized protein